MKSEKELLSIIQSHEKTAIGGDTGELATERSLALDRYFGRLYGNEQEGRSKVVSKDISDAIDWIMPSLIRVFLSSDDVCRFDPVGPEDEEAAEQESDYVNHVIMKENNGFCILHDWFKDALLLKNGYVKRWWDEQEEVTHESYTDLDVDSMTLLLDELAQSGDTIDVVGSDSKQIPGPEGLAEVFTVKIKRTRKKGKVTIEPVPPEEILVSNRTRGDLQKAPFAAHVTQKTRSELVEMGMKQEWVDSLPAWNDRTDIEHVSRDTMEDETTSSDSPDKATQEVEYKEVYARIDHDEDGIAELRRIVVCGGKIPEGDEWNMEIDEIPLSYLTPNRLTHRHIGLSVYDELKDIAEIKTALIRGTLDNTYQLTNSEWMVNERVNLSDFMQSRPNGIKRISGKEPIMDSAAPVQKPSIVQHVIPVLDYVDTLKETRTGVGRNVMGLDADTLKKTTEGAARMALQQANSKIEMIARLFAETGVKDLALAIHALLIKHQDKPKVIKLNNNWIQVNPQEWKTRTDMTVTVGLGTGSQEETRANLLLLADLQERAFQAGIVTPRNVYNLAEKASAALGFKQKGEFFSDPDSPEVQQAQQAKQAPNPLAEAEQIKGQFRMESDKVKYQMEHEHKMHLMDFEKYKFDKQHALDIAKAEIEAAKNAVPADLGQPGMGTETQAPSMQLSISELGAVSEAATNGVAQMAEQLQALVQQNQQMWAALMENMNRPINIIRDKSGKVMGAARQ